MKRKPMTKTTRFEVFKRDSFTCQYCGAKAPDAILCVDHIVPVKEGGTNDILNLVTSCDPCNSGKGAVRLSDESAIEKSRKQAELLQQRREQIEMIAAWYQELATQEDLVVEAASGFVPRGSEGRLTPNEHGTGLLKKWTRKYGLAEIIEATNVAFDQYFKDSQETWEKAFSMIPRIAHIRKIAKNDPSLAEAYRLRGILRYKINYLDHVKSLDILASLVDAGDAVYAEQLCHTSKSWTHFVHQAVDRMEVIRKCSRGNSSSSAPN